MTRCERTAAVAGAARLVRGARETAAGYAGEGAPAGAAELDALLRRAGCHVEIFSFRSDAVAMVLPRCGGAYPLLLDRGADAAERALALRHELAHVLAGDADGALFLLDEGYMSPAERVADLFALADLVPGWWLEGLRAAGEPWRAVAAEAAAAMADFGARWPPARTRDRAVLRLRLFKDHGI